MKPLVAARLFVRMLRFDEGAIREIASNPWSVVYGLVAAVIAGLARHYDRPDLLQWLWLGPALSVGVAVAGSLLFFVSGWIAGARNAGYRPFLAVFAFTSPLGWLYGVPFELLLGQENSKAFNFVLLIAVSVWRVLIVLEAYKILMGLSPLKRVLSFLVPAGAVVGGLSGCAGLGALVMAGMMGTDEMRDTNRQAEVAVMIFLVLTVLTPICVIGKLKGWKARAESEESDGIVETPP